MTSGHQRGKLLALLLVAVLFACLVAGCGSANQNDATSGGAAGVAAPAEMYDTAVQVTNLAADGRSSKEAGVTAPAHPSADHSAAAAAAMQRKIIYTAEVTMEVEDFDGAQARLHELVAASGGYMLHFSDNRNVRRIGGHFTMKVPAEGFNAFLEQVEQLKKGSEFRRIVRGQDVTEEYVDLDARLGAKEAVEARLLELMKQATEAQDLLAFSNELARVQEEIESVKGRMRYIHENVAYSTVELHMYQEIDAGVRRPGDDRLQSRLGRALVGSAEGVIRFLGDALVFVAGALPVLLLLALIAVPVTLLARRYSKKRKARAARTGSSGQSPSSMTTREAPVHDQPADREGEGRGGQSNNGK